MLAMTKSAETNEHSSKVYEAGFLLSPHLSEEKLSGVVSSFKDAVTREGGAMISDDFPKLRELAYPIQKTIGHTKETFGSAYFGWIKFETNSDNIPAVEKVFKNDNDVIRFLLISTVRENTLSASAHRTGGRTAARAEKSAMSEEEIEKTVEALVAE